VDEAAFPPLTDVAGVAPACALAGAFAKASPNPSSGRAIRSIAVFVRRQQKPRGGGPVPPSKGILKTSKNPRPVTEGTNFRAPNDPLPVQHTPGVDAEGCAEGRSHARPALEQQTTQGIFQASSPRCTGISACKEYVRRPRDDAPSPVALGAQG
jgi:hypothetical protein